MRCVGPIEQEFGDGVVARDSDYFRLFRVSGQIAKLVYLLTRIVQRNDRIGAFSELKGNAGYPLSGS